jgi:hypothetical protein
VAKQYGHITGLALHDFSVLLTSAAMRNTGAKQPKRLLIELALVELALEERLFRDTTMRNEPGQI